MLLAFKRAAFLWAPSQAKKVTDRLQAAHSGCHGKRDERSLGALSFLRRAIPLRRRKRNSVANAFSHLFYFIFLFFHAKFGSKQSSGQSLGAHPGSREDSLSLAGPEICL